MLSLGFDVREISSVSSLGSSSPGFSECSRISIPGQIFAWVVLRVGVKLSSIRARTGLSDDSWKQSDEPHPYRFFDVREKNRTPQFRNRAQRGILEGGRVSSNDTGLFEVRRDDLNHQFFILSPEFPALIRCQNDFGCDNADLQP